MASKCLWVNLATPMFLFINVPVILALTFSLKLVLHGLNVRRRATQSKASFVQERYFAENMLMNAKTTNATKHIDIIPPNYHQTKIQSNESNSIPYLSLVIFCRASINVSTSSLVL